MLGSAAHLFAIVSVEQVLHDDDMELLGSTRLGVPEANAVSSKDLG